MLAARVPEGEFDVQRAARLLGVMRGALHKIEEGK
jgi:hypothetical protein